MTIEIKRLWIDSPTHTFEEFCAEDPDKAGIWVNVSIGAHASPGADDFRVFVCTAEWLQRNCTSMGIWGRHLLIFQRLDPEDVRASIREIIRTVDGKPWVEAARLLSRSLAWEFEDYSG